MARSAPPAQQRLGTVLGSPRAESDGGMLNVAFVATADFEILLRGPSQNFVVGRRGAGKSALFLQLVRAFRERNDHLALALTPEEYRIKGLVASVKTCLGEEARYTEVRSLMRVVWRSAILASVQDLLQSSGGAQPVRPPWLAEDVLATVQRLLVELPAGATPESVVYAAAQLAKLDQLEAAASERLASLGKRAIFVVDRLDEGWVPRDVEAGIVGGLCSAAADLRDHSTSVHVLVFLRDNVFRLLGEIDDDFSRNIAGDTLRLRWTQPALLDLVGRRLKASMGLQEVGIKAWNRFAKLELQGNDGFSECLRRTLYRPRDILELLNNAAQTAQRSGRAEILKVDIDDAAQDISTSRLNDLLKEYDEVFPGLRSYVSVFSGRSTVDTLSNILSLLGETVQEMPPNARRTLARLGTSLEVVHELFGVGFLGFELSGSGFQFCHDGADKPTKALPMSMRVAIHPCYSRALRTSDVDEQTFDVLLAVNDEYGEQKPDKHVVARTILSAGARLKNEVSRIALGETGAKAFEDWAFRVLSVRG
jgi:hypothetical protein